MNKKIVSSLICFLTLSLGASTVLANKTHIPEKKNHNKTQYQHVILLVK